MAPAGFLQRLFRGSGRGVEELARRLGLSVQELSAVEPAYREFSVPKRSGGARRISAPVPALKAMQRRILRRLLGRLSSHPAAHGFEPGHSIVTNALPHVGKAVVVRMDLKEFFPSTSAGRVRDYFRAIGWNREAARLLVRLCTYEGSLPQGAPTSPRLSNLLNRLLDARLTGLAQRFGCTYTRYADDLTFSFAEDAPASVRAVIRTAKAVVAKEGYTLHQRRKLHIRRPYERQLVTGLVVNTAPNLPRQTRRWLRAVAHRLESRRQATLTRQQHQGWQALTSMIASQAGRAAD